MSIFKYGTNSTTVGKKRHDISGAFVWLFWVCLLAFLIGGAIQLGLRLVAAEPYLPYGVRG